MHERVTIGFGFTSDWLRNWREFFKPITKRRSAKPKQTRSTFDSQVKTALSLLNRKGFNKSILASRDADLCPVAIFVFFFGAKKTGHKGELMSTGSHGKD